MGFIEELARRRQSEEQRKSDEEASRRRAQEAREAANRQALEEEGRRRALKTQALSSSLVPGMANKLGEALGNDGVSVGGYGPSGDVEISTRLIQRGQEYEFVKRFIHVEGLEDGSVIVGRKKLSASEARDPAIVDSALESAYKSPQSERRKAEHNPDRRVGT